MSELFDADGVIAWIAQLLPGKGRPMPSGYSRIRAWAIDGGHYLSLDGLSVIVVVAAVLWALDTMAKGAGLP